MKIIAVVAALLAVCVLASAHPMTEDHYQFLFTKFIKQHNKVYSLDEFFARFNTFKTNLDFVREHNTGSHTYTVSMNEFGDLTPGEFKTGLLGFADAVRAKRAYRVADVLDESDLAANVSVPDSIDWTEKNAVTPVKNQGQCGSCWSFSTTGSVEGAWAIKTGKLVSLSEQELMDCSTTFGNNGCNGGLMDNAFKWIIANKGICAEKDYPYLTKDGTCQLTRCKSVVQISSYSDVAPNNEDALKAAVAQQPVSVAIEADQRAFQFYSGGVLPASQCGTNLDHGVLVVGYGHDDKANMDFWKVKNSWGASWGTNGYINLQRNVGGAGTCGILTAASFPVV